MTKDGRIMVSEQHDDHMWMNVGGKTYSIHHIEWPIIYFWRGYYPNLELTSVDMTDFNIERYIEEWDKIMEIIRR